MSNVMFKRGPSTNLPWSSAVDGAFYLTSDTNRLYVGNGTTLAELNRYVKTVANTAALEKLENIHENDFAYIADKNILAVYAPNKDNGNQLEWHQVNVNTNTDTSVTTVTFTDGTVVEAANGREKSIKIDMTLNQVNTNVLTGATSAGKTITQSLYIPATAFSSMEIDVAVDTGATVDVENNVATIKNKGTGAAGDGFTITGGENIVIGGTTDAITINSSDTLYNLTIDGTEIGLVDSDGVESTTKVSIIGDNDWIATTNENGNIKISHASKTVSKPAAASGGELDEDDEFTVVSGLTVDDNNHVTGITTTKYTSKNTTYTPELSLNTNKEVVVTLKDQDDNAISDSLDISHTIKVDDTTITVKPGTNIGAFYSQTAIDNKLKALNAMTYKGVVNSESDLPSVAQIGDTYKVGTAFTLSIDGKEVSLKIGDLLIVNNSNENESGNVTTNIAWDRIESGEAADTTYDLAATGNKITLTDSHSTVDTITVDDDDVVVLTASNNVLKAEHKAFVKATATDGGDESISAGGTITAVTGIATDGYGHTTGFTTKDFTIPGEDKVEANATNVKLTFKNGNDVQQGSIDLDAGAELAVTGTSTDNKNLVATIAHNTVTKNDTTGTVSPKHSGNFNVVESITYNNYGHVSGVKTTTVTLPSETTYTMHGATAQNNIATWELKNDSGVLMGDSIAITSESLKIGANASKQATIELEWGTF